MRLRKTYSEYAELLEENKKLVLVAMVIIMLLGIGKIYFEKSLKTDVLTEDLNEKDFVETKPLYTGSGIGIFEMLEVYSEVKALDKSDTLQIKKMNEKLDKIISNE